MTTVVTPFPRPLAAGARLMAHAWAAYCEALRRGDPTASGFAEWLAAFWEPALDRPDGAPDARSALVAHGRRIEWFERDDWVFGIIPGSAGGYLVPRLAILAHPWLTALSPAA
jgi:hypothetical protein